MCNVVQCLFNSPQVSSLLAGSGSDPPEGEDTSNLLSEWCDYVCFFSQYMYKEAAVYKCVSVFPLQLMKVL